MKLILNVEHEEKNDQHFSPVYIQNVHKATVS